MMSRVMTLGALTFSLFLLGLFAGGGISSGRTSPVVAPEQLVASPELAVPQMPAFDAGDLSSAGQASESADQDVAFSFDLQSIQPASFDAVADEQQLSVTPVSATSEKARRDAEQRIRRIFPDADAETVSAWAETLQDMPAREQEDLLQQKRAISGSLNSIFTPSLQSPRRSLPPLAAEAPSVEKLSNRGAQPSPDTTRTPDITRTAVLQNLRQLRSVGYRALLVLPAAVPALSGNGGEQQNLLQVRSFEPGRRIAAALPLAVSLPDDAGLWLQLSDGLLTRRGDLQRAADGSGLGLLIAGEFRSLAGTWSLQAGETVSITERGEVLGGANPEGAAGERRSCGSLPVVRVSQLAVLQSDDGVHFRIADGSMPEPVPAGDIRVLPGTLELSNVNVLEEQALLNSLPVQ